MYIFGEYYVDEGMEVFENARAVSWLRAVVSRYFSVQSPHDSHRRLDSIASHSVFLDNMIWMHLFMHICISVLITVFVVGS